MLLESENVEFKSVFTADLYKDDVMDSFVWHIVWNREENMSLDELNEKELQYLLRDIVGEAG